MKSGSEEVLESSSTGISVSVAELATLSGEQASAKLHKVERQFASECGSPQARETALAIRSCNDAYRKHMDLPPLGSSDPCKDDSATGAASGTGSGRQYPEFAQVPGDCFDMGSTPSTAPDRDSDEVLHRVCLSSFEISRHEITFRQYELFAAEARKGRPADEGWGRGSRPVTNIAQRDAAQYASWLGKKLGRNIRLPTEAEWEFAARGGVNSRYWWGDEPSHEYANFDGVQGRDQFSNTAPVGSFDANSFGLHDTAGNVWEFTCSAYVRTPDGSEQRCAPADYSGEIVIRGGGWNSDDKWIRPAARGRNKSGAVRDYFGFRVVALPDADR